MRYEFQCPWCGADSTVRGTAAKWRMQMPCDLCSRDIVLTFDGCGVVSRCAEGPLVRDDQTTRIRFAR